jgi:hypothetical protein
MLARLIVPNQTLSTGKVSETVNSSKWLNAQRCSSSLAQNAVPITAACRGFARGFSPVGEVARGKTRAELLQCGNVWLGSIVRITAAQHWQPLCSNQRT